MPLRLTSIPASAVRKHGKIFHVHSQIKMHVAAVRVDRRVGKRVISTRVGTLCPFCGFEANDFYHQRRLQVLERMRSVKG